MNPELNIRSLLARLHSDDNSDYKRGRQFNPEPPLASPHIRVNIQTIPNNSPKSNKFDILARYFWLLEMLFF